VTTVANILIPPTISVSEKQVRPGGLLTVSGQSIPAAQVSTEIRAGKSAPSSLEAEGDPLGKWALQLDTGALKEGFHTAKALFKVHDTLKSGFGRSVSFYIGEGSPLEDISPDLNGDGKVNLIDFSIFLTNWGSDDIRADFNQDGTVNLADFSIMLFNWTG
jgi:hypothetical protein